MHAVELPAQRVGIAEAERVGDSVDRLAVSAEIGQKLNAALLEVNLNRVDYRIWLVGVCAQGQHSQHGRQYVKQSFHHRLESYHASKGEKAPNNATRDFTPGAASSHAWF